MKIKQIRVIVVVSGIHGNFCNPDDEHAVKNDNVGINFHRGYDNTLDRTPF